MGTNFFWSSEGAGVKWPGSDASLLGVIAFVIVVAFGLVALVRGSDAIPQGATS